MIQFRDSILSGDWNVAENLLCYLEIKDNEMNVIIQ